MNFRYALNLNDQVLKELDALSAHQSPDEPSSCVVEKSVRMFPSTAMGVCNTHVCSCGSWKMEDRGLTVLANSVSIWA